MKIDYFSEIKGIAKQRWFRSKDSEYFFGISEDEFLVLSKEEGFPTPVKISQKMKIWDRIEVAFWLSQNTDNRIARNFVKEFKKNATNIKPFPLLMKKASVARYLGISPSVMELLIHRFEDFPKPKQAFFETPVYTVTSVNGWLYNKKIV